jgi:hypothetical protein
MVMMEGIRGRGHERGEDSILEGFDGWFESDILFPRNSLKFHSPNYTEFYGNSNGITEVKIPVKFRTSIFLWTFDY